jgi:hypothetical protein
MGFRNDDPQLRYRAGYFTDDQGAVIRDLPDLDPHCRLSQMLSPFGLSAKDLPQAARGAFEARRAYTLVILRDVSELAASPQRAQVVDAAITDLCGHPQAAMTIELGLPISIGLQSSCGPSSVPTRLLVRR